MLTLKKSKNLTLLYQGLPLVGFAFGIIKGVILYSLLPHTSKDDKEKPERPQKLCTRIMIPYKSEYD